LRRPAALAEGIPPYLYNALSHWLEGVFGYRDTSGMREDVMLQVAAMANIEVTRTYDKADMMRAIIGRGKDDTMLDILDAALEVQRGTGTHATLKAILQDGGSAWAVREDGRGLERRVDPATMGAYKAAITPQDAASAELEEAWANAYGCNPDASDAWDPKATLGNVLGEIKAAPTKLSVLLKTSSTTITEVETIEAMLRLI
jgi:hypothetical protein